jgi:flavorubredoxin
MHRDSTHQAPTQIAADTFVIHDHVGEGTAPVMVPINSMVIRGREPVVVDTGYAANHDRFFADVFSLVEPEDIRWVFISHDDIDHAGNMAELMERAPNATLIINWFMAERMGPALEVSPLRMRWVGDGETIDVGDRTLVAVRPPVYDSPTTRGLFDPRTGVYWASDAFGSPITSLATNASQLEREPWIEGLAMFSQYVAPWFELIDDTKYQRSVDRVELLGVSVIAGCHGPTIGSDLVRDAIATTRRFHEMVVPPQPGQQLLDQILASITMQPDLEASM